MAARGSVPYEAGEPVARRDTLKQLRSVGYDARERAFVIFRIETPMAQRPVRQMPVPAHPFEGLALEEWILQLRRAPSPEHRYRALQAVAFLAEPSQAAGLMLPALADGDSDVRALAGRLLGKASAVADVTPLQQALTDVDPDVRFEAARTLLRWGNSETTGPITALTQLLDDDGTQPLMLAAIVETLRGTPAGRAAIVPRLEKLLASEQGEVREETTAACIELGPEVAGHVNRLVELADDEEPLVREHAVKTLGRLGIVTLELRAALEMAADDEDEIVAAAAKESLSLIVDR